MSTPAKSSRKPYPKASPKPANDVELIVRWSGARRGPCAFCRTTLGADIGPFVSLDGKPDARVCDACGAERCPRMVKLARLFARRVLAKGTIDG